MFRAVLFLTSSDQWQDICSYNVEQARGDDGCNIVSIVMHQFQTDLHGAMEWIDEHHKRLADRFLSQYGNLPTWGPAIDAQVARYLHGIGNWVRANDVWSFESQRYFGLDGLHVERSRLVTLLPRIAESQVPACSGLMGVGANMEKIRHLISRLRALAVLSLWVLVASFAIRMHA